MSLSDKIAKFMIETFTTHKFEDLTPVEVTLIEGMLFIMILVVLV